MLSLSNDPVKDHKRRKYQMKKWTRILMLAMVLCALMAIPALAASTVTLDGGELTGVNAVKTVHAYCPIVFDDLTFEIYFVESGSTFQVADDYVNSDISNSWIYPLTFTVGAPTFSSIWLDYHRIVWFDDEESGMPIGTEYTFTSGSYVIQQTTPDGSTTNSGAIFVVVGTGEGIPDELNHPVFTDIPAADSYEYCYYFDPVQWAVATGITNGTSETTFSPNNTCTRGEIITFLWRAAGSPEPEGLAVPVDASANDFYYKAIQWAIEQGMTDGGAFRPNDPCTREDTVLFLWKYFGKEETTSAIPFTDVTLGGDTARAVAWAVENGVTYGTSETTFSPNGTCTRAEIVTFLYRAFPSARYY
jgi:hypothetical protein